MKTLLRSLLAALVLSAPLAACTAPVESTETGESEQAAAVQAKHVALTADLERADDVARLVDRATAELGGVDAFVSAAGVVEYQHSSALEPAALERQHLVNFARPLEIALNAGRILPADGAIVFVASTLGLAPAPLTLAYGASKASLIAATRSLALELGPRGIRVNAVAPGPVWTPLNPSEKEAEDVAQFGAKTPMRRPAQPEEIAPAYVFLASSHCSSYITGEILPIIGGY